MNKYEKLIEYIVNEDQAKAKALFHEIVVEKSREIYESIIEDELGGDEVEGMVDDVTADEEGMSDSEDEFGGEEFGGEEGEGEGDIEDRVMDLEDALDELKAEFDALMADEEGEAEHHDGINDPDFGGEEGGEEEFGGEEEVEGMYESAEEDDSEEEDDEEDVAESRKSSAERIREYVEKVSDGHGAEKKGGAEGSVVGKDQSSKPTVNSKGIVAGKNDMGGSSANIVKGGAEQAPDGTSPKGKVGGFVKKGGDLIGNVENRVNSKTKGYTNKEGAKKGEDGGVNKTSIEAGGK